MLASDVISRVRPILADETATYRWADADLLLLLNDGVRNVWSRRPDSHYTSAGVYQTSITEATAVGDTLTVSDQFRAALVQYVAYRAFEFDADDQQNQASANSAMQQFNLLLQSV